MPHTQRARGTPYWSTITAVPACRMSCSSVACPLKNPWFVTRVSLRRSTDVSPLMYANIGDCDALHAGPRLCLVGVGGKEVDQLLLVASRLVERAAVQTGRSSRVHGDRRSRTRRSEGPGREHRCSRGRSTPHAGPSVTGVSTGIVELGDGLATDAENGSGPTALAGCKKISPPELPVPPATFFLPLPGAQRNRTANQRKQDDEHDRNSPVAPRRTRRPRRRPRRRRARRRPGGRSRGWGRSVVGVCHLRKPPFRLLHRWQKVVASYTSRTQRRVGGHDRQGQQLNRGTLPHSHKRVATRSRTPSQRVWDVSGRLGSSRGWPGPRRRALVGLRG